MAAKAYASNLVSFLNYRQDMYLVGLMAGQSALGLYSVAVTLAELVWVLPNAISQILFPKLGAVQRDEAGALTARVSRVTVVVSIISAAVLAAVSYPIVHVVYGEAYASSYVPLLILLPGTVAFSLAKVFSGYFSAMNRLGFASVISTVTMVVNLLSNLVLIPALGIRGAALASAISYTFSCALGVWYVARLVRKPAARFLLPAGDDVRLAFSTARRLVGRSRA
jgi:O-antigen/teichoic acid export membrane protein